MALPALLPPESLEAVAQQLDAAVAERVRAWAPAYGALVDEMRRTNPTEGSAEEQALLDRSLHLMLDLQRPLGLAFFRVLELSFDREAESVLREEFATPDVTRKLAMRHLQDALRTLGVLQELMANVLREASQDDLNALAHYLDLAREHQLHPDAQALSFLRWQLDLVVALEAVKAAPSELAFWANRAAVGSRRVEAMLAAAGPLSLRGDLARMRAQLAWTNWDDAEVARELAPWKRTA